MDKVEDVQHVFYINLKSRTDREREVENELEKIGISSPHRFDAFKLPDPRLGCSMSHLKCLMNAKENNLSHVMIVEDDIQFLDPTLFLTQCNKFLSTRKDWDVILLAGNNMPPYVEVDDTCIKVGSCQTTTGYLVNGHYIETLANNIKEGMTKLMKYPDNHFYYAIDKYWFQLQRKDKWYLIVPLSVTQREGYSDIEKRQVNVTKRMLDLDKKSLLNSMSINNGK
jgi:GR25 family glycosyltransferase involved in LPS biosynthesis